MIIEGLDSDYYCVHNPIPVKVKVISTTLEAHPLLVSFGVGDMTTVEYKYTARYYNIERVGNENIFYIDMSQWLRQLMVNFEETQIYTTTPTSHPFDYTKQMTIKFEALDEGSSGGVFEETTTTRHFVHCALTSYNLPEDDEPLCCIKVWRYYPFSSPFQGYNDRMMLIPTGEVCNQILGICEKVDYTANPCKGAYLKWLNDKGHYSYWLFPQVQVFEREGREIDRKPRSPFSQYLSSNEDTFGFDVTETVEVRDIIYKQYWATLKSLIGSPEIYMLKTSWQTGNETEAKPNDWIKIIQDKPKFERNQRNNTAEFEMTFELPKVYTQKLI